jgi:hypothetical protein
MIHRTAQTATSGKQYSLKTVPIKKGIKSVTAMLEQRVQRGAQLLDEKVPDWRSKIDVERLDISDFRDCILGQLFGSYRTGLREMGLASILVGVDYGFDMNLDVVLDINLRAELHELWRNEIAQVAHV